MGIFEQRWIVLKKRTKQYLGSKLKTVILKQNFGTLINKNENSDNNLAND